jgi:hypothetical protein
VVPVDLVQYLTAILLNERVKSRRTENK